jgi:hypothetical protein
MHSTHTSEQEVSFDFTGVITAIIAVANFITADSSATE